MQNKTFLSLFILFFFIMSPVSHAESPWMKNESYLGKTFGKLGFGLKNAGFFWLQPFKEAKEPAYSNEWEGFCYGLAQGVQYMVGGLMQVATFPIPVDFPDMGSGLTGIPDAVEAKQKRKEHLASLGETEPMTAEPQEMKQEMKKEMPKPTGTSSVTAMPSKTKTTSPVLEQTSERVWETGPSMTTPTKKSEPVKPMVEEKPAPRKPVMKQEPVRKPTPPAFSAPTPNKKAPEDMRIPKSHQDTWDTEDLETGREALPSDPEWVKKDQRKYYDKAYDETTDELGDLSDVEAAIQELLAETE